VAKFSNSNRNIKGNKSKIKIGVQESQCLTEGEDPGDCKICYSVVLERGCKSFFGRRKRGLQINTGVADERASPSDSRILHTLKRGSLLHRLSATKTNKRDYPPRSSKLLVYLSEGNNEKDTAWVLRLPRVISPATPVSSVGLLSLLQRLLPVRHQHGFAFAGLLLLPRVRYQHQFSRTLGFSAITCAPTTPVCANNTRTLVLLLPRVRHHTSSLAVVTKPRP
jgi:hypothetical protein